MRIYIYGSQNGIFGRNNNGAYMTESQVLDNDSFIEKDSKGNEFIDTKFLYHNKDYYTKKDIEKICKKYNVDYELLVDMLDWQSPETLAEELGEHDSNIDYY